MDMVSKRYTYPCFLLDGYIQTRRLCEFVGEVMKFHNEDYLYNFYLHKVFDKTYEEFCTELKTAQDNQNMGAELMKATVNESLSILGNFTPKEGD